MNSKQDSALLQCFFSLNTVGQLRNFCARLDTTNYEHAALAYYISTWPEFAKADDAAAFSPTAKLSEDRSAVMYGNAPVIFEGTNQWALKPYLPTAQLASKLQGFETVIRGIREANRDARMTLLLIPEKDHIISRFLLKEERFQKLEAAVDELRGRMSLLDVKLVFCQPFHNIDKFQTLADFEYKDSHLSGRVYVTVFGFLLESLGISWARIKNEIGLRKLPEFGDLAAKFENGKPTQSLVLQPDMPGGKVTQTAGSETFAEPLGETWQKFQNEGALIDHSVCLLGDSHCSLYSQRKLSYLFANTFRETHFEWNPCGTRKKPDVASYDNVVLEISSRFVV